MKRKYENITKPLKVTYGETKKLVVLRPSYLLCDVCHVPVYFYEYCIGNDVYCSRSCYDVLQLSKKNEYLDINDKRNFMEIDKN